MRVTLFAVTTQYAPLCYIQKNGVKGVYDFNAISFMPTFSKKKHVCGDDDEVTSSKISELEKNEKKIFNLANEEKL